MTGSPHASGDRRDPLPPNRNGRPAVVDGESHARTASSLDGLRGCWTGLVRPLIEAGCWTLAYPFAQGIVLILFLILLLTAAYGLHWPEQQELLNLALELNLDRSFLLVGVTTLGALFLIVPAVRWRLGRDFRQQLGWHVPRREQLILAIATIAPIAIVGDAVYEATRDWYASWINPDSMNGSALAFRSGFVMELVSDAKWSLASVVQTSSLEQLHRTFEGVPYPVLVVAIALGPAIGEELVFRGMIGRRLIRHWGAVWGTLVASACFALAHVSPAHVLATFPVAVLLQLLYMQTRTIWVPILVHFGNNLLAVSMVRFQIVPSGPVPPLVLAGICLYLVVILLLLEAYRRDWWPSAPTTNMV
jgi:uncharacterized protein